MKISNSKKQLAEIIHENGGWRDGAEWAAQDKRHCGQSNVISFYEDAKPWFNGGDFWRGNGVHDDRVLAGTLVPNWHQTILSRDEYFHLYPAPDADGWISFNGDNKPEFGDMVVDVKLRQGGISGCGPQCVDCWDWTVEGYDSDIIAYRLHKPEQVKSTAVGDGETNLAANEELDAMEYKPSIEQLAADYRNAKDYAERKQQEADAAKDDAGAKLAELVAAGKEFGLALSVAEPEPELVITDWRDLRVGDEVDASYRGIERVVGSVLKIDAGDSNQPIFVSDGGKSVWATEFRFIRRP